MLLGAAQRVLVGMRHIHPRTCNLVPEEVADHAFTALKAARGRDPTRYAELDPDGPDMQRILWRYCQHATRDLVRNELRHHRKRCDYDVGQVAAEADSPLERSEAVEAEFEKVRAAVDARAWRLVCLLRAGNTPQQAAEAMGTSVDNVYQMLHRIKLAVRARYEHGG